MSENNELFRFFVNQNLRLNALEETLPSLQTKVEVLKVLNDRLRVSEKTCETKIRELETENKRLQTTMHQETIRLSETTKELEFTRGELMKVLKRERDLDLELKKEKEEGQRRKVKMRQMFREMGEG